MLRPSSARSPLPVTPRPGVSGSLAIQQTSVPQCRCGSTGVGAVASFIEPLRKPARSMVTYV